MTSRTAAGKEVKEGRDVLRRVPSARMFACYYCRQIPTSRAADAHYNCKRGLTRARALSRVAEGNIRMHWDVHSEVSRFRVLQRGAGEWGHPSLLPSFAPATAGVCDRRATQPPHKGGKFNIFVLEGKLSQSPLKMNRGMRSRI